MKLEEMTVGQLRAVLHGGAEHDTLAESIERMDAATEATAAHEERQRQKQRERDDWLAGRERARQVAHLNARVDNAHKGDPMANAAGRAAGNAAVLAYERKHPLPEGLPKRMLHEQPGLAQRVVDRVRP